MSKSFQGLRLVCETRSRISQRPNILSRCSQERKKERLGRTARSKLKAKAPELRRQHAKCIKLYQKIRYSSLQETFFRCLKPGHLSRDCQSRSNCTGCNKRHHTILHGVNPTNKTGQIQSYNSQGRIQEAQNGHPDSITATANASSVSLTSPG